MNAKTLATRTMLCLLTSATPALAAQTVGEDHSGLVVWGFLGFCALIVIAQLAPAIALLAGRLRETLANKDRPQSRSAKGAPGRA